MRDFEERDETYLGRRAEPIGDADSPFDRDEPRRSDFDHPATDVTRDDPARVGGYQDRPSDGRTAAVDVAPLFAQSESADFRSRWQNIQTDFVDEPRRSVEKADALVKEVTDRLTDVFTRNRDELERQWSAGDEVSTEDLRRALQSYRSFFERLLSM